MKKTLNKWLACLVAITMLLVSLPLSALAAPKADLTIDSLEDIQKFAADVNNGTDYSGKIVEVTADIDIGGQNNPWVAIGTASHPFKGTFDGNNHVISGLYIASGSSVGFFGEVNGGTIKSLTVKGSVTGTGDVAGVVGKLTAGKIENCGNQAAVSGGNNVGGVAGSVNGDATVSGCYNSGNITGTIGYIGGVTGQHWRAGTVENCYNVGVVTGPATVGGVVGGHKAASPVVTNCYNAGAVVNSNSSANNHGSVIGATKGTAENCYDLSASSFAGVGSTGAEVNTVTTLTASQLGAAFKADDENLNNGYPVLTWQAKIADEIISTYDQLKAFANQVNGGNTFEGKLIRLDVNIALGGQNNPWVAIGTTSHPFKGTFDGNNHVISGLYIASGSSVGFFGEVNGGTIKSLTVKGSVTGTGDVAGVVGKLTAGKIENCGNQAAVSGGNNVGGVAGSVNGDATVSGCYNSGNITGTIGYIGGVTGQHWRAGMVENCYNVGVVTGPATVGGVVGGHKAASAVMTNCYNAGTVLDATGNKNNIGSLVGATKGTTTNCYYLTSSSLTGSGSGEKDGITATDAIDANKLGSGYEASASYPILTWEKSVSTDAPVRPSFVESTALSAELAGYIKASVASSKTKAGLSSSDSLLGDPNYMSGASSTGTDWMALAMGRFGYFDAGDGNYYNLINDGDGYSKYLNAMKSYMETTYQNNNGILHSAKATEWHRGVVAITALGGNPLEFGIYQGSPINLIADGSYNCSLKNGPGTQGINGWIWGLIALDSGSYAVPSDAKYTRERFITEILKLQLTDGKNGNEYGGWVLGGYGGSSDVDITAMAIQSLAPYYNDDTVYTYVNENSNKEVSKTVRACVDEALDRLGSMMNANAGFSSWNTNNVESIAQVVVALTALGIDPAKDSRFVTANGETLLDGMLKFQLSDGGFCHVLGGGWNSMANDQATYALVSYWRFENSMRSLYDMRANWTEAEKAEIETASKAIENLPDPSDAAFKKELKSALSLYRAVSKSERRYVQNYATLASAIELVGGEAALDTAAAYITSLSVTKSPDKIKYYEGDFFDATGMVVTANYSDGQAKTITDYKISPVSELSLGTDTVYITYGILKTSVSILVREKKPWSGEGTKSDPYLIKTADDLVDLDTYVRVNLMNTADIYFKMTQDINMANIENWHAIAGDASYQNAGFRGNFDGSGFAIWNLNSTSDHVSGLFGELGDGAVLENLGVASGTIGASGLYSQGAIAGSIGSNATATIRNCWNAADVTGLWGIGGILGSVEDGGHAVIENCRNAGTVTASYQGGGILGAVGPNRWQNNAAYATVTNCYNVGTIRGSGNWGNGGIVGNYQLCGTLVQSKIRNCYNVGAVSGTVSGAIIGSAVESDVLLDNVYYLEGSHASANGIFDDDGSYTPGKITGEAHVKSALEMKTADFVSTLGVAYARDNTNINQGYPIFIGQAAISAEPPVQAGLSISTAEELVAFAQRVNNGESFKNKTIVLVNHIDLSDISDWKQIGTSKNQFQGIFDGQGYVLDNLTSTTGGLFGTVGVYAVIRNVGVASGEIGQSGSHLSFIGGIAGWSNGADFINCFNGADINCGGYSGGIVGTVRDGGKSLISGCYNVGNIKSTDGQVGGIVGHLDTSRTGTSVEVTLENCYNAGFITAEDTVAGIVGKAQDGHVIRNCYNAGNIVSSDKNEAAPIAGSVTSDNQIENCYYNSDKYSFGIASGNDTTIGKTTAQLKTDEFLNLLGSAFKQDSFGLVNEGYPILSWQRTTDADAVADVITKIDAIGVVSLNSSDQINAARNAYDNLDSALQALVSNLSVLEKAESDLLAMQTLEQAKKTALDQLQTYKDISAYRAEQQHEIESILADGKTAIQAAATTAEVTDALSQAKAALDQIKTSLQLQNEEDAKSVSEKIGEIGTVTLESEAVIQEARKAYNALSDEAKAIVSNYTLLEEAEARLTELKNASPEKSIANEGEDGQTASPNTGDTSRIIPYVLLMFMSASCMLVLTKKKKTQA